MRKYGHCNCSLLRNLPSQQKFTNPAQKVHLTCEIVGFASYNDIKKRSTLAVSTIIYTYERASNADPRDLETTWSPFSRRVRYHLLRRRWRTYQNYRLL